MQPVWDDDVMAEGYDPRQPHYSIGHAGLKDLLLIQKSPSEARWG